VKLAVEEVESQALLTAIEGQGPYITSVVGEVEAVRACRRASVPGDQIDRLRDALVVIGLDEEVRQLAAAADPPPLRTLDAIHLATALSLVPELNRLVTYDARLAEAAELAGLPVAAPS
jgi:predicted nucleic acid-binding protein